MSARLTSLDPRWVVDQGQRRVGVSFACPTCAGMAEPACSGRVAVFVDPPFDPGPVFLPAWSRVGDTFDDLTITPSIRVSLGRDGEHWHGFVIGGQVTP